MLDRNVSNEGNDSKQHHVEKEEKKEYVHEREEKIREVKHQ